ncbi:hypothetical protein NM688_g5121 [Phlebia brevispora]|uniref:Uncharacterized protein n=1 Tax=Phlebia brevispora TaxID=194682 RepID=A0ACC1T0F9_9APHY|nr:hypothetical protein NM688_g5121 [Phlebia brevispora]
MFGRTAIYAFFASGLLSTLVSAACPADQSIELCCITVETFGQGYYVFHDVCGYTLDNSTVMAAGCDEVPDGCSSFHGWYDACCNSTLLCQSGVDGPFGVDCTATPIE